MAEKVKGKVLNLIIKQHWFDQILSGKKTKEYREVKPSTVKRLLQLDKDGYEVVDDYGNAQPIKYDYLRLYVGYNKDRDTALVEVKDAYCEIFTEPVKDENGVPMKFKADKDGNPIMYKVDENDQFVKDENGNYIEDPVDGIPLEDPNGVEFDLPIETQMVDEDGNPKFDPETGEPIIWVEEQVVYELGKVVEKSVKSNLY